MRVHNTQELILTGLQKMNHNRDSI